MSANRSSAETAQQPSSVSVVWGKRTAPAPTVVPQSRQMVRAVTGLPTVADIQAEIDLAWEILFLDAPDQPVQDGLRTGLVNAQRIYERMLYVRSMIERSAARGSRSAGKGGPHYRLRTGELATIIEAAKARLSVESRFLTAIEIEQQGARQGWAAP